jgi:hypothetical protein
MALYQADILEEEVVRQWGTHVSKKYVDKDKSKKVRKSADAFLKVSLIKPVLYLSRRADVNSGSTRPRSLQRRRTKISFSESGPDQAVSRVPFASRPI